MTLEEGLNCGVIVWQTSWSRLNVFCFDTSEKTSKTTFQVATFNRKRKSKENVFDLCNKNSKFSMAIHHDDYYLIQQRCFTHDWKRCCCCCCCVDTTSFLFNLKCPWIRTNGRLLLYICVYHICFTFTRKKTDYILFCRRENPLILP